MSLAQELKKTLPMYHSRALCQEFIHSFGHYANSKPTFLKEAYRRLTGDAAEASTAEEEVDKRVAKLLEIGDPNLNTGRPESHSFLRRKQALPGGFS